MSSLFTHRFYSFTVLLITIFVSAQVWGQQTQVANVRTTIDPQNLELVVTYDILSIRKGDSLAVVFFVDGERVTPQPGTLRGDIGLGMRKGINNQLRWNFSHENLSGSRSIVAEIVGTAIWKPGLFSGKRGHLAIYGLIGGVAAGLYGVTLAGKITSDVKAYNQLPDPTSSQAEQALQAQKSTIEQKKTIFYASIGVAVALFIVDGFLLSKNKKDLKRPSVTLNAPFGAPSATVAWSIR